MRALIRSHAVISPQNTLSGGFPQELTDLVTDRLTCIEPEYRELISPLMLRRMPRIIRMGLASAKLCTDRSGGVVPEGTIIGTGLGCLDNLEKFLMEMLEKEERITTVLPFINSTHNAVAGQISMLMKNQNYSTTYCHRGFSFESALTDALMLINEGKALNVLVGGIDECTSDFVKLHNYLGSWKTPVGNINLYDEKSPGTIAGEGSAFFMLSAGDNDELPAVTGVHTFFAAEPPSPENISEEITSFLARNGVENIDVFMAGMNGDIRHDGIYEEIHRTMFRTRPMVCWKHLSGEYYTSTAFAMWLGSVILKDQTIPDITMRIPAAHEGIRNILVYNQIRHSEHSFILLSRD